MTINHYDYSTDFSDIVFDYNKNIQPRPGKVPTFLCLKIAGANVLTLEYNKDQEQHVPDPGMMIPGRSEIVRAQFHKARYNITAFMEARTKTSMTRITDQYIILASQCTPKGQYGCELSFATDIPYAVQGDEQ